MLPPTGALKALKEITPVLAGEKRVTVSAVKPIVQHATTEVLVDKQGDSHLTKETKEWMKVHLKLCYSDSDIDQLLLIASFLDSIHSNKSMLMIENILEEVNGILNNFHFYYWVNSNKMQAKNDQELCLCHIRVTKLHFLHQLDTCLHRNCP